MKSLFVIITSALLLASCGSSKTDRSLSGGAIGAAIGAAGASAIGENTISGAAIGGAIGAAVGVATDENDVDLGNPIWK